MQEMLIDMDVDRFLHVEMRKNELIPVQSIFILKRYKGDFYYFSFAEYKNPEVIESWNVKKFETEPFTEVENLNDNENLSDIENLMEDSVIGICGAGHVLWIKPQKHVLLIQAKRAYRRAKYNILIVARKKIGDTVVSKAVDCIIDLRLKDINGQCHFKSVLGMTGFDDGESVLLNEPINGFNSIGGAGHTAESIRDAVAEAVGIKKKNVAVRMIDLNVIGEE